jgi:hypothetical protein
VCCFYPWFGCNLVLANSQDKTKKSTTKTNKHTKNKQNKQKQKNKHTKNPKNQWGEMSKQTRNKQTKTPGSGSIEFQSYFKFWCYSSSIQS